MTLGNYGIFLIMGNAGFCPSAVLQVKLSGLRLDGFELLPEQEVPKTPQTPNLWNLDPNSETSNALNPEKGPHRL